MTSSTDGGDGGVVGVDVAGQVLAGVDNCPPEVRAIVAAVAEAVGTPLAGGLVSGAGLADRLAVLGRLQVVITAEVGRTLAAAEAAGALAYTPGVFLQRRAGWAGGAAGATVAAARLAARHQQLARLWRSGGVSGEAVAVLARQLKGLPVATEGQFLAAVIEQLPRLSVAGVRVVARRFLDLLHPHDRDAQEQTDWDRRTVTFSQHGGMVTVVGEFPRLEGEAIVTALQAVAQSLRTAGDSRHAGQRRADALITLVNRAASRGDLPATRSGLPVATTITVGVSEADRVAAGQSREGITDLAHDVGAGTDPGALAVTGHGHGLTLGDAAVRFALCAGDHTGVVIDDTATRGGAIARALAVTRVQPLAVGRRFRLATAAQRTALALRDGGCILCQQPPAECQTHHVTDWSHGGATDLDQLVLLCWVHHREVDLHRWRIERNPDTSPDQPYWIVTPTPRHQWQQPAA